MFKKLLVAGIVLITISALFVGAFYLWQADRSESNAGIAVASGRIEATQVDVATKLAGRLLELRPHEGDMVEAGEEVGRLESAEYVAQIDISTADAERARQTLAVAESLIAVRRSESTLAQLEFNRTSTLARKGVTADETLDRRQQQLDAAVANLRSSEAQALEAKAAIASAEAMISHMKSYLADTQLKAPTRGRVQYRLVEPGAVLAAGARVLVLVDLTDVYMVTFVPAAVAGQLGIGDQARIVLDAVPISPLRASITFIDPEAQFTPKAVETKTERERLMFRVKLRIAKSDVAAMENKAWVGLRGSAYLKTDPTATWPANTLVKEAPGAP